MYIESTHIVRYVGEQACCARCNRFLPGPKEGRYENGARVGLIETTAAGVVTTYAISAQHETTPMPCSELK